MKRRTQSQSLFSVLIVRRQWQNLNIFFWRVDNWNVQVRCAAGYVFSSSNVTASESKLYCSCIPDCLAYYFSGLLS